MPGASCDPAYPNSRTCICAGCLRAPRVCFQSVLTYLQKRTVRMHFVYGRPESVHWEVPRQTAAAWGRTLLGYNVTALGPGGCSFYITLFQSLIVVAWKLTLYSQGGREAGAMFTQGRSTLLTQQTLGGGLPCSRPCAAGQRGRSAAHVTCVATPTRPPTTKTAKRCASLSSSAEQRAC